MNERPWMTIVIATYNSSKFLPRLSEMLKRQDCPDQCQDLEILAVDGGSTDDTRALAEHLGFRVLDNPDGNAISAKQVGLKNASSRLVCILDHDEVLLKNDSLKKRFEAFNLDSSLRVMISAGYEFSEKDSTANMYASEFGDPLSMSTYRCPNNSDHRIDVYGRRLEVVQEINDLFIFRAATERRPILCEVAAGSGTIDADFFRLTFPAMLEEPNIFPHAYYLLGQKDHIGVIVGDSIRHDSAESWSVVRKKISWRVNNAVRQTSISTSGLVGRSHSDLYSPRRQLLQFAIYAGLVFPVIVDSFVLVVTRRRLGYLNHFVLTYFVVLEAIRLKLGRVFGRAVSDIRYGQ